MAKNHAFHNGNKRTAVAALLTVLYRNDKRLMSNITDDDIYDFALGVASNEFPSVTHNLNVDEIVKEISRWISSNSEPMSSQFGSMRTTEFIKKCQSAGASVKDGKSGTFVITKDDRRITFSKSTKQIDGAVVKRWLHDLRLDEIHAGVGVDDFIDEAFDAREQILRFRAALNRLAKT